MSRRSKSYSSSPYEALRRPAKRVKTQHISLSSGSSIAPTLVVPTLDELDVPRVNEYSARIEPPRGLLDTSDCDTDRERAREARREDERVRFWLAKEEAAKNLGEAVARSHQQRYGNPYQVASDFLADHADSEVVKAYKKVSENPYSTNHEKAEAYMMLQGFGADLQAIYNSNRK